MRPAAALAVGNRGWRWAQPRQRLKFCAAISLWLSRGKSRSTPSAPAGPTTASSTLCPKRCRTPSVIGSRLGLPADLGNAVTLLCSAEANWITGQVLDVDGGASLMDAHLPLEVQQIPGKQAHAA